MHRCHRDLLADESTWASSEGIEAEFDFKNLPHAGPLGGRLTSEIDSPTEKCCILVDSRSFAPIICLEIPLNYHISPLLDIPIENLQIQSKNLGDFVTNADLKSEKKNT